MWNVADAEEIKPHTLEIMNYVKPRPDYLIVGTGEKQVSLDFTFYEHFRRMGITVDSCPSVRLLSFLPFYSLRLVVPLICAMKTDIMWRVLWCSPGLLMKAVKILYPKVLLIIMNIDLLKL